MKFGVNAWSYPQNLSRRGGYAACEGRGVRGL